MKNFKISQILRIFIITLFFVLAVPRPTYAYLDLGSGSYLFQMAIASLLAGVFVFKSFWMRMIAFFTSLIPKRRRDKEGHDQEIHA